MWNTEGSQRKRAEFQKIMLKITQTKPNKNAK